MHLPVFAEKYWAWLFLVCLCLNHEAPGTDMLSHDILEIFRDPIRYKFKVIFVPLFDSFQDDIFDGTSVIVD